MGPHRRRRAGRAHECPGNLRDDARIEDGGRGERVSNPAGWARSGRWRAARGAGAGDSAGGAAQCGREGAADHGDGGGDERERDDAWELHASVCVCRVE